MMPLSPFHRPTVTLLTCMALGICIPLVSSCWKNPTTQNADDWDELESICGTASDNGKIAGGSDVSSTTTWPWMAVLERSDGGYCSAVIVASRFVITAATCVDGQDRSQLTLRFDITDRRDTQQGVTRGVYWMHVHHNYVSASNSADGVPHSDMALLILDSAVTFNSHVRPVCLPDPDGGDLRNSNCWAVGWGVKEGGVFSNKLQELKMTHFTKPVCQAKVDANGWGITLEDTNICAEGYSDPANQNTAAGDSGGPLVCKWGFGLWTFEGMNSFGSHPDVFVRVSKFSRWISDYINAYAGPRPFLAVAKRWQRQN